MNDFGLSQPIGTPMLPCMTSRFIACALISATVFSLTSCGPDPDLPTMAGNTQAAASQGETFYQKAKAADDAGKSGKAIRLYDETATRYPFAPSAAQARFRQAQLLEQKGEIVKSFEAYDKFLSRFEGSREIPMGDFKRALKGLKVSNTSTSSSSRSHS